MTSPTTSRTTRRLRPVSLFLTVAMVLAGLVVGGWAGPAGAAVVSSSSSATNPAPPRPDGTCGIRTMLTASGTESFTEKEGKGRNAGITLYTYEATFHNTYRDPETGAVLYVARGKFKVKDTKAKPLGGGLFEITTKQTGVSVIIEDGAGRVRGRDTGAATFRFIVNDEGQFVEFISGRFPGPPAESQCKIVGSFLGTGSSDRLTAYPLESPQAPPLGYYEYLPPTYDPNGKKSPLLLFFHGYGGSGDGSAEQLPFLLNDAAIPTYINTDNWPADRPFVVLFPQHDSTEDPAQPYNCPELLGGTCVMFEQHERGNPEGDSPCTRPQEVEAFLDYAVAQYNVDTSRVYLTGLSCGAYGVWEAIPELSGRIAAAVPIAGDGRPALEAACDRWTTPIWAFHGEVDDVVDPAGSVETVGSLRACPSPLDEDDLALTTYPGVGHDSWDLAYSGTEDGEDIYSWLLERTSG